MIKKLFYSFFLISGITAANAQTVVTVDVARLGSSIQPQTVGLCLSYPTDGGTYFPNAKQTFAQGIETLKSGTLRFPMGTLADNYLWHTPGDYANASKGLKPQVCSTTEAPSQWPEFCNADGTMKPVALDFDEYMALVKKTGTIPVVMVNAFGASLPGTRISYEQLKANAVEWVRYANKVRKYNVKYWEIGNELSVEVTRKHITPEQYVSLFNDFAAAMKAVDPTIKIGFGAGFKYFELLNQIAPLVDFVVPHQYNSMVHNYSDYKNVEEVTTSSIKSANDAIDKMPAQYRDKMEILITEFNSSIPGAKKWLDADGKLDPTNTLVKSLYTLELMLSALQKYDRIRFMHQWVTHNPFGKKGLDDSYTNSFDGEMNILPQGKAQQVFNNAVGSRMVDMPAGYGTVHAYGMYTPETKKLSVILINKDSVAKTVTVDLKNFTGSAKNTVWEYRSETNDPADQHPVYRQTAPAKSGKDGFTMEMPPVCVRVITLGTVK